MTDSDPSLVTGAMLGTFLAFGVDTIVVVAALWYVGRLPATVTGGAAAAVLGVFLLWIVGRWVRLRRRNVADEADAAVDGSETDPVERLKRRYADGEVSDEEFEGRLDRLLDADARGDAASNGEREPEFKSK
ncbi:SHOCT domain-containing protein [Halobaculum gomorrense]|uniref:Short C-terminal domain-containing protein n=1 Tax=Halobaculum gomorrense TaxID=43928 RepID=A0A1M5Q7X0_9EURY|nr:SHOCT domain-containing protein [Halobaculum gomorrense]SHH09869.1 Short C-terminal domain-containing protein [Halobaculum gomorrense]